MDFEWIRWRHPIGLEFPRGNIRNSTNLYYDPFIISKLYGLFDNRQGTSSTTTSKRTTRTTRLGPKTVNTSTARHSNHQDKYHNIVIGHPVKNESCTGNVKDFQASICSVQGRRLGKHLDLLETEVFQREDFKPKQAYFAIKITIFGEPERCLRRLEIGIERPNLKSFIPTWYSPKEEDWKALYLKWPFSQLSYSLRCDIIIIYFFHKFERGTSQKALHRFEDALQGENEQIEQWGTRLEGYEMAAKRYGVRIPFSAYLRQWMHGTRPGYFLTELRKAKNPASPGKMSMVHDRDSFDLWYHNMMANFRQTKREQEGHMQLKIKDRQNNYAQYRNRPMQSSRKARTTPSSTTRKDLQRQGPGYKRERNPHSQLFQRERSESDKTKTANNSNKPDKDMSKVKCFN